MRSGGELLLPAVEEELCVAKCGPSGPLPGVPTAEAFCDGWDAKLTADSNALCLSRSAATFSASFRDAQKISARFLQFCRHYF